MGRLSVWVVWGYLTRNGDITEIVEISSSEVRAEKAVAKISAGPTCRYAKLEAIPYELDERFWLDGFFTEVYRPE